MRIRKSILTVTTLALCLVAFSSVRAQTTESTGPAGAANGQGVRSATLLTINGQVSAVDEAKRLVTLDVNGRKVTLQVDNPVNLKAAKVGTPVVIRYYEVVSIRKKKPGEEIPSISVKDGIVTAKPGGPAGAVASQNAKVLVTVDSVDLANGTVTVKGPDGGAETVRARDPRILRHVKPGDELVVSISRATAISLEPEPGK